MFIENILQFSCQTLCVVMATLEPAATEHDLTPSLVK